MGGGRTGEEGNWVEEELGGREFGNEMLCFLTKAKLRLEDEERKRDKEKDEEDEEDEMDKRTETKIDKTMEL